MFHLNIQKNNLKIQLSYSIQFQSLNMKMNLQFELFYFQFQSDFVYVCMEDQLYYFIIFLNIQSPKRGNMSLFLLENEDFINRTLEQKISLVCQGQKRSISNNFYNQDLFLLELKKMKELAYCQSYSYIRKINEKKYSILIANNKKYYQLMMTITITKNKQMSIEFSFLTQRSTYFKFNNKHRIVEFIKQQQRYLKAGLSLFSISVNKDNGYVKLSLPLIISQDPIIFPAIFKNFFGSNRIFARKQCLSSQLIEFISHVNSQKSEQHYLNKQQVNIDPQNYKDLIRYHNILMSGNNIIESSKQSQRQIKRNQVSQVKKINRLVQDYQKEIEPVLMKINRVYEGDQKFNCQQMKSASFYNLKEQEMNHIKQLIAIPHLPKPKNKLDNNMIFNCVKLLNPESIKLQRINQGGFTYIYLAQIFFHYIHSEDGSELKTLRQSAVSDFKKQTSIHKLVVIKQEQACRMNELTDTYNRNQHQIAILKRIKLGVCIFLPKYYFTMNCPKLLSHSIMLDYIPFNNLRTYFNSNAQSLSLLSKLYFLFSIVQALKYISDYKIVHLDLKPTNIMIFCNMIIKLIDFGQSYHPQVCTHKKYQPGYTIPYSSPEVFNNKTGKFTSKSDVFSFGILMYELLYNKFPYYTNQTQTLDTNFEHYLSKWYFTPQQNEIYGHKTIHKILMSLISRCISNDPNNRPELDWISVLIRQCIKVLNS